MSRRSFREGLPSTNGASAASGQGRGGGQAENLADRDGGDPPRILVACRVDGGTRFVIKTDPTRWGSALRALITEKCLGHRELPFAIRNQEGAKLHGVAMRKDAAVLHFRDRAYLKLYPNGRVVVEAKTPALWMEGLEVWMRQWFETIRWLTGSKHAVFRVHELHLCSDFQGIRFDLLDARNFTGGSAVTPTYAGNETQSLEVGQKKSDARIKIYNKSSQLKSQRRAHAESSVYESRWRQAIGYDESADVWRVESKLKGRALHLDSADDSTEIDLRDPACLLDAEQLQRIWLHETTRRRLVLRTDERRTRCAVDPRWEFVQSAAKTPPEQLRRSTAYRDAARAELGDVRRRHLRTGSMLAALRGEPGASLNRVAEISAYEIMSAAQHSVQDESLRARASTEFLTRADHFDDSDPFASLLAKEEESNV